MWIVWDKISDINGFSASDFYERNRHLRYEDTIYLKIVNGRVVQVGGKGVLASVYGIDPTLPDDEFIAAYEAAIAEPIEEPMEEE